MPYGTIKVDTVTFTNDGVDKSVSISGLVQNPTFSGNVTVTGTISGVTVTGTTASFTSGNFTNISGGTHTITSGVFAAGSAASPSITFTGDLNTGIYSPGADQVAISTGGSPRVTVTSTGVGIGTTSPSTLLHVNAGSGTSAYATFTGNNGSPEGFLIGQDTSGLTRLFHNGANPITFWTSATERCRIDGSGRLLVGTSSARSGVFFNGDALAPTIQLEGTTSSTCYSATRVSDGGGDAVFVFAKARGATVGSTTVVQNGDGLGTITFQGADGSEFVEAARISAAVDDTPGANDMPGRLVFSTTADGASSPTERMRIGSNGDISLSPSGTTRGVIIGNAFYDPVNAAGIQIANSTGTGRSLSAVNGSGALQDNYMNLGDPATRWGTVYAATGTINTSDADLKQDVGDLDTAELNVATAIKSLIKKFRFIDAVAEKGSDARIHVGVIAQEVEQAFVDEGLDPRRYGLFCEDTLKDGSKRLGIRYDELLAFVIAAL